MKRIDASWPCVLSLSTALWRLGGGADREGRRHHDRGRGTGAPSLVPVIHQAHPFTARRPRPFECLALGTHQRRSGNRGVGSSIPTSCT